MNGPGVEDNLSIAALCAQNWTHLQGGVGGDVAGVLFTLVKQQVLVHCSL